MAGGLGHGIGSKEGPQKPPVQRKMLPTPRRVLQPVSGGSPPTPSGITVTPTGTQQGPPPTTGPGRGPGGGSGAGGGLFTLPHWFQFKRPSWYHGLWPISSMANTIRDAEFAFLGDLSQWNYNSQTFQGFSILGSISVPQGITVPSGMLLFIVVLDPNGNQVGTNGTGDALANQIAVDVDGSYAMTTSYTISGYLIFPTTKSGLQSPGRIPGTYSFGSISLTGAEFKAGIALTFTINAQQWQAYSSSTPIAEG